MSHKTWEKALLLGAVLVVLATAAILLIFKSAPPEANNEPINNEPTTNDSSSAAIEYRNNEYGFTVALPDSWRNYKVDVDQWSGDAIGDQLGDSHYTQGPVVSIHNPKWTGPNSYQDIPIMVFTITQWEDLEAEKFHIGAAPVNPTELGRNSKYVFALPARYNFSYPPGVEDVQQIIDSKPLKTFEPK